jgi:hypothetical protein
MSSRSCIVISVPGLEVISSVFLTRSKNGEIKVAYLQLSPEYSWTHGSWTTSRVTRALPYLYSLALEGSLAKSKGRSRRATDC